MFEMCHLGEKFQKLNYSFLKCVILVINLSNETPHVLNVSFSLFLAVSRNLHFEKASP